ncbi:MAG: hypothetical protein KC502_09980 [Myxococcales bacterium]|nr:hypothetical protein [Myxococcales bacterium]
MHSRTRRLLLPALIAALTTCGCSDDSQSTSQADVVAAGDSSSDGGGEDVDSGDVDSGDVDGAASQQDVSDDVGASSDAAGSGSDVSSMAALCAVIAKETCRPMGTCCKAEKSRFSSQSACETEIGDKCTAGAAKQVALVAAGDAVFNSAHATACANHFKAVATSCTTPSSEVTATRCALAITAKANVGDLCPKGTDSLRCGEGDGGLCFPTPTETRCRPVAKLGQTCKDAVCTGYHQGSLKLCMPPLTGSGDICDVPRGAGAPCKATVHCNSAHWCSAGSCAPRGKSGDKCTKALHCSAGLHCDPMAEKCAPVKTKGAPCYQHSACGEGLSCGDVTIGKVCMLGSADDGKEGGAGLGKPCDGGCAKGLKCADGPVAGKCKPSACLLLAPTKA